MQQATNLLWELPIDNEQGSGHNLSFERSYCMLVLYSLIQFRNYQASNFNIINLQFACFIVQKFLCKRMAASLLQIKTLVEHNHLLLDKTDDIELFFGKIGSNRVTDCDTPVQAYFYWMHKVMKNANCFHSRFYEENNLLQFTKLTYEKITSTQDQNAAQLRSLANHAAEQTEKYSVAYMSEIMPVVKVTLAL